MESSSMLVKMFYVLVFLSILCNSGAEITPDFKFVQIMELEGFENFKQSADVRVMYFYKRDLPRLRSFYREFERSAELLDVYSVKCGYVDCTKSPKKGYCNKKKVEHNVYAFRDGYELLQLELESMFDVNSILSNILQLVLLRDVPIVQSASELADLEDSVKGQHDLIFSYHRAIGTYEHRLYMEVAFAYQNKFKFALTTEKGVTEDFPGAKDDAKLASMLWGLECKFVRAEDKCVPHQYTGKLELTEVVSFVKALGLPPVFHMPDNGPVAPYEDVPLHLLNLYHDGAGRRQMYEYADALGKQFRGMIGVITVNVDRKEDLHEDYQRQRFGGVLPTAQIRLRNKVDHFMSEELDLTSLTRFVSDALKDFVKGVNRVGRDVQSETGETRYANQLEEIERVEKQDDQVAKAVFDLRVKEMQLDNVPALTDKTFPITVQQRDMLMVLFYLKVDARSQAFLRAYGDASVRFSMPTESQLARVECHDWTDVCERENITSYPTVRIYRRGHSPMDYKGHLEENSILSTLQLLKSKSVINLSNMEQTHLFLDGAYLEGVPITPVSVLALLTEEQDAQNFQSAAETFHGHSLFGLVTDKKLGQQLAKEYKTEIPAIILLKTDDPYQSHVIYKREREVAQIIKFVNDASIPAFTELTAMNFPSYHRQFKPLLVVFRNNADTSVIDCVGEVVRSGEFPWALFGWINVEAVGGLGAKILYQYAKQPNIPHISLVIRHKAEVYNFRDPVISTDTIQQWLRSIHEGKTHPSTNLPREAWKPKHEGFNFLKMIDEGLDEMYEDDDVDIINDQGLGFDENGFDQYANDDGDELAEMGDEVDEIYNDPDPIEDPEVEVNDIHHSRLGGHHKRPKHGDDLATGSPSTQSPTTHGMESQTHDGGEL